MKATRSILIPDGEDEQALRVLRCLAQIPHLEVSVLSRDSRAPIRFSRHHHQFMTHRVDGCDRAKIGVIKETAKAVGAHIILPTGLSGIRLIAEHQVELAHVARLPPIASKELIDRLADKVLLAEIMEREGIPYPNIRRVRSVPVDEEQLAGLNFPALVKPRNLEAGNGIRLCKTPAQIIDYLLGQSDPCSFFIQEFISGPDIDCSALCENGEILAYTIQRGIARSPKPFRPPAAIEFVHNQGVLDSIQKLVRSVQWSGVVNFDLILDQETNKAWLLEANPRYWRSLLGSLKAGVNFPYLACLASEGHQINQLPYRNISYAKPDLALRILLKKWTGHRPEISGSLENGLGFVFRDPLPEMAMQLKKFL
jgi:predicted ATP-grasp superfamily ATP-dependent carboligase